MEKAKFTAGKWRVARFVRIPYDAKSKSCKYHVSLTNTHGEKS